MTKTIAIAGKGGTGKTTIAALLIQLLAKKGVVLAIDADPSSNLHLALGLPLTSSVGEVREEMLTAVKGGKFNPGMAKHDYIDLRVHESLVESSGIDLLAMGRPEGPGCYCAANNMLRTTIDRLETNYDFVVIDNEAGMEHISRQTTRDVDILLIISDSSMRGVITAIRTRDLIKELRTHVEKVALVLNRTAGQLSSEVQQSIAESGLDLIATFPVDPMVTDLDGKGTALKELPENSVMKQGVETLARKLSII
ncbi:MAG: Cobyrinic acid ac-diamide synthase [Dehalococcoidia bacterium]|nr:Cobyrinic acid ac-diamide synthase [Dehalococcoidia bacterium]